MGWRSFIRLLCRTIDVLLLLLLYRCGRKIKHSREITWKFIIDFHRIVHFLADYMFDLFTAFKITVYKFPG